MDDDEEYKPEIKWEGNGYLLQITNKEQGRHLGLLVSLLSDGKLLICIYYILLKFNCNLIVYW